MDLEYVGVDYKKKTKNKTIMHKNHNHKIRHTIKRNNK